VPEAPVTTPVNRTKAWELLPLSVKEVSPNTRNTNNEATAHAQLYI